MAGALNKFLKAANRTGSWQKTVETAGDGSFVTHPDGQYIVQMAGAELQESKAGKPQIKFDFVFVDGDFSGKHQYDYLQLAGSLELAPLAWRLRELGVAIEDINIEDLQSVLDDLVEQQLVMKITLKTKGEYQNLKINALLPDFEVEQEYTSTKVDEEEEEEDGEEAPANTSSEEEEEVDLQVGMKIEYGDDVDQAEGVITKIDEDKEVATVKNENGKLVKVPFNTILQVIEEGNDE